MLTPALYSTPTAWLERHYPYHLTPDDLADPQLLNESRQALDELALLLDLRLPRLV